MKKMFEIPGFFETRPQRILEICEYLSPIMNEIHGTQYSFRFWASLLKDYAKNCVNRENMMSDKVIDSNPALLSINGWNLPTIKDEWRTSLRHYLKIFITDNQSIVNLHKKISKYDNICIGTRSKILEEYGFGISCSVHSPFSLGYFGREKRRIANKLAHKENSVFYHNLIRHIPRYYVEHFGSLIKKIKLIDPKKKCFYAEHITYFTQLVIALYVEHGAKFYKVQVGGYVGETMESISPENYMDIDKHLTYGWKIHEKDEPSKAYRLEEFKKNYDASRQIDPYDLSIIYNQISTKQKKIYYSGVSRKFFQKIDQTKFPSILLRPRGFTKKIDNSGELAFLYPPEGILIGRGMKPMAEIVKNTRVIVHLNHPSTNFLECVYVDHPVIARLTNKNPTEIIKPFYQFFLESKVMHKNIDSLVAHLNEVNIEKWWNEVIRQPMYKQFKNQFARSVLEVTPQIDFQN